MTTISIHAIVHGKVQGVFFRDNTRRRATELNIGGWVKNNDNGTVELKARGDEEKIKLLVEWLHEGPARAKIENVDWREIDEVLSDEFIIQR